METNNQFDAFRYFNALTASNKLCHEHGFICTSCSGIGGLEGAINEYLSSPNLIIVSDTTTAKTFSQGVSFFEEQVYTVFIVMSFEHRNMGDRQKKLNIAREIFRQFHSKLIYDKFYTNNDELAQQLEFLKPNSVYSRELDGSFINGKTGLYIMLNNQEPVDLSYDSSQWLVRIFDDTFDNTYG